MLQDINYRNAPSRLVWGWCMHCAGAMPPLPSTEGRAVSRRRRRLTAVHAAPLTCWPMHVVQQSAILLAAAAQATKPCASCKWRPGPDRAAHKAQFTKAATHAVGLVHKNVQHEAGQAGAVTAVDELQATIFRRAACKHWLAIHWAAERHYTSFQMLRVTALLLATSETLRAIAPSPYATRQVTKRAKGTANSLEAL